MHALVTGGGGFLGRYIVEQLIARGDRVRSLARRGNPSLKRLGVEIVMGDIRNYGVVLKACSEVDCVIHTAALAGIQHDWQKFYDVNVLGTNHIVECCQRQQVGRLIFSSSPSVTFGGTSQEGIDESAPYPKKWHADYAHTKALAEQAVLSANGADGLRTCALRPHLIWGPRDQHLIPRLIARARSGRLRQVGDGTNLVDMVYVENAATAQLQAADALAEENSPVAGRAYFLSQGEPVNCWGWINEILALADLPPVEKSISYPAAWKIGAALERIYRWLRLHGEPPMTRFLAAQLATSHWFDISAARRDFGYDPQVSTAEGMQRLGEWLSKQDL